VGDWRASLQQSVAIEKKLPDEIHEFLTKVFNVYFIQLPPQLFKQFDIVRDKLIPLTVRFDESQYREFCDFFSKIVRSTIADKSVSEEVKKLVRELADKTNKFFESKGLGRCVEELKYVRIRVRVLFQGKPLGGATVNAVTGGKTAASAQTNDEGIAELELPTGKYSIYVCKQLDVDSYVYDEKEVEVREEGQELVFSIESAKSYAEIERETGRRPRIREVS